MKLNHSFLFPESSVKKNQNFPFSVRYFGGKALPLLMIALSLSSAVDFLLGVVFQWNFEVDCIAIT